MNWLKQVCYATTLWLVLVEADVLIELFRIHQTHTTTTLMGMKLVVVMTKHSLTINFIVTAQLLVSFVIVLGLWFLGKAGWRHYRTAA